MTLTVCGPGCPLLVPRGTRCAQHRRETEKRRGTRQDRGYDADHDRLRAWWAPRVATGTVRCANPQCLRPQDPFIHPDELWDLGHTPTREAHRGPEHARCNRSEGGRAAHR